jgi:hypothetical protein
LQQDLKGADGDEAETNSGAAASARAARPSGLAMLWSCSAGLALLATLIIYRSAPGINWGIWSTLAAVALTGLLHRTGRPAGRDVIALAAMAAALGWSASITSDGFLHFWIAASIATLLALAVLVAAGLPMRMVGALRLVVAPVVAGAYALVETVRRQGEAIGLLRGGYPVQVVRGVLMAIPALLIFGTLLAGADPIFDASLGRLMRAVEQLSHVDRVIAFGFFGVITLGGFGTAVRGVTGLGESRIAATGRPLFGDTERAIVLGSVAVLFGIFLLLQLAYLFGNPAAAQGSGITYAEHARRGFGELTAAATLCTLMLVGLERWKLAGSRESLVRWLSMALIVELHLLLESALRRVHLYEAAYGYTVDRLYAQFYMLLVSVALLLLAREIWVGLDVRRLTRRTAGVACLALLGVTLWNHQAWIAERNIARAAADGKLDAAHLAWGLSLDAAPTVVANMDRFTAEQQVEVRRALHQRHYDPAARTAPRIWEWNARRNAGVRALLAAGIPLDQAPDYPAPVVSAAPSETPSPR